MKGKASLLLPAEYDEKKYYTDRTAASIDFKEAIVLSIIEDNLCLSISTNVTPLIFPENVKKEGDKLGEIPSFLNCVTGFWKNPIICISNRLIFLLIISLFVMILMLSVPLDSSSD